MNIKRITWTLVTASTAICLFAALGDDRYNCHNYAWESSENEAYRRWLEDPTLHIEAAVECDKNEATHIVYFEDSCPIHSGLYLGWGFVKSKWGANPVVVSPVWCSPYGTDVKYYRR